MNLKHKPPKKKRGKVQKYSCSSKRYSSYIFENRGNCVEPNFVLLEKLEKHQQQHCTFAVEKIWDIKSHVMILLKSYETFDCSAKKINLINAAPHMK